MFTDIIWDFDGTLFDTYPGMVTAFQKALREQEVNADNDEILKLMKISLGHAIDYYKENYAVDAAALADRFTYYENMLDREVFKPFQGVYEICKAFAKKNGRNFIFTHRENLTIKLLEYYHMDELFTEVVTREYGFKRKPDPEGFLYIINKYNIEKDNAIAIGDRELDMLAAKNAGIKSCLYDRGLISSIYKADYEIESLEQLVDILKI